ncbi:MAG: ABC transporter ATP-binding protein [Halanaerobiales bacterium]|nr:ABC transporter ATP-binding protein [Halanaerobiales bacterium]
MRRIFKAMKNTVWMYSIGLLGASLCFAFRGVLMAKIMKDLYDAAEAGDFDLLVRCLLIDCAYILITAILNPIFFYMIDRACFRTTGGVQRMLYDKVKVLPIQYFKNEHSGNLISKLTNDITVFEQAYFGGFTNVIFAGFGCIGAMVYMFMLDYRLALIGLVTGSAGLIINALYAKPLRLVARKIQDRLGFLNETFTDMYNGISVIKSYNLYSTIAKKYLKKNEDVYKASVTLVKRNAELATFNNLARWLDILGYILVGAYFAINGWVTIGTIIALSQLKNPVMNFFRQLGGLIANLQASLAAGDRIWEVLDQPEEPKVYSNLGTPDKINTDYAVFLKDLSFSYQEDEKVIDKLSLEVKKGTKVALVGPSGGGKSTIFKLLMGFYQPECGEIVVNGKSLNEEELSSLRDDISYVPQNAHLFTGTIIDNIKYGNKDATEEDIIRAAKIANAHEFISAFEKGYDTMVGERGAQLSGGQRQRIAIARAVLKDAPILLLDEATSSLDTETESLVQQALDRLSEGRTTLVIAHRLATVQDSDEILIIDEGKLKERGSHIELLAIENGLYQSLHTQQYRLGEAS